MLTFDNLLDSIGAFRRYQKTMLLVVLATVATWSVDHLLDDIVVQPVNHRCKVPSIEVLGFDQVIDIAIPFDSKNEITSKCTFYKEFAQTLEVRNFKESTSMENKTNVSQYFIGWNRSFHVDNLQKMVICDEWIYDYRYISKNSFSKFNLICSHTFYINALKTLFIVSNMAGYVISGAMSDVNGRHRTLIKLQMFKVIGYLMAMSNIFIMFFISRLFIGIGSAGTLLTSYVMMIEMVGVEHRHLVICFLYTCKSLGSLLLLGLSLAFKSHDTYLHGSLLLINVLIWLLLAYGVVESPRWLITRQQPEYLEKANRIIRFIAYANNRKISKSFSIDKYKVPLIHYKDELFNLFSSKHLKKSMLILYILWFLIGWIFYKLNYDIMSFNYKYITFTKSLNSFNILYCKIAIVSVCDLIAYFCLILVNNIRMIGRRDVMRILLLFLTSLLSCSFLPIHREEDIVHKILIVLIGRILISGIFQTFLVFTMELAPTVVRQDLLGTCLCVSNIPHLILINLFQSLNRSNHSDVISAMAMISVLAASLVPSLRETRMEPLLDTIETSETFIPNDWQREIVTKRKLGPVTVVLSKDSSLESFPDASNMKFSQITSITCDTSDKKALTKFKPYHLSSYQSHE